MTGWAEPFPGLLAELARAGLDLHGALSIARYDALVPAAFRAGALGWKARAALVLGGTGPRFARAAFAAAAPGTTDPLDRFAERTLEGARAALTAAGRRAAVVPAHEARDGRYADFVALGEAAGFGWPSRLGLLLHPEAGPWMHLRGALLVDGVLPEAGPRPPEDAPCAGCPAPCTDACPVQAPGPGGFSAGRCAEGRRSVAACASACAARRACVIGDPGAYAADLEAWHMAHSPLGR